SGTGFTTADAVKFEYAPASAVPANAPRVNSTMREVAVQGLTADQTRFPVYQRSTVRELGGNVRGFGMLAKYGAAGPGEVYLKRVTARPQNEAMRPVTLASVYDPEGNCAAVYDFTDIDDSPFEIVIDIPSAEAEGAWRVSFTGGRTGDSLEIGLPATDIWGVRGEMALGLTETTPEKAYIYAAQFTRPDAEQTHRNTLPSGFIGIEAYGAADVELFDPNGVSVGKPEQVGSRRLLVSEDVRENGVYTLNIAKAEGALVLDGVPALLCPNRASAEYLKGGSVAYGGFTFAGPLQARIYRQMVKIAEAGTDVTLTYPAAVPADLRNPQLEAVNYGGYSVLSSMDAFLSAQVLDPANPRFGQVVASDKNRNTTTAAIAAVAEGALNPAYQNEALIRRAILQSLGDLIWTQGDGLLRTGDLRTTSYPREGVIFSYNTLNAEPFYLLNAYADEETRALWKTAVLGVTDKLADFRGYEPNQWSFVMLGLLHTYLGSGEPRILRYFERCMNAYLDNAYGVNSKFGQHPAGYYLEEGGPDGNYDSLNLFHCAAAYNLYRDLPEAKPELLAKFQNSFDKSMNFLKLFWLRQPDGKLYAPTAMNCRTDASLSSQNYPGAYLLRYENPLAYRRFMMNLPGKPDYSDLGGSASMSQIANTDEWAVKTLEAVLPKAGAYSATTKDRGVFTSALLNAYARPIQTEQGEIPTDAQNGTWELPGIVAFKRGGLYGMVFYEVAGSTANLRGNFGGGPTVFWTEGTGNAVTSMRNAAAGVVKTENDVTHACVAGIRADGTVFATGGEHPVLTWLEPEKKFELSGGLSAIQGKLSWTYTLNDNEITVTVRLDAEEELSSAYVNIPLYHRGAYSTGERAENGRYTFAVGEAKVDLLWDAALQAEYAERLTVGGKVGSMDCVRLPISNAAPVTFTVRAN
ncbi:MAG: hypothetical protein LBH54_03995, partial [Clostridiales bacterium]|nr:hypothetical protein [Clostridiales bacterium]